MQHLFLMIVLNCLVPTNQEDEEEWNQSTYEYAGDLDFTGFFNYSTFTYEYVDHAPCSTEVHGLNSVGLMIVYIIVFVFAAVGNSVVIFVICSMKKNKASTDIYLMHLAVADLLFCLTLPFWAIDIHFGWLSGNFLCKLLSGFQEASVYGSVFLLACISVDRYFAIVRATRMLSSNHLLVKVLCAVLWLIAGVLSLPVAIKREDIYDEDLGKNICYENITGESSDHWRVSMRILRHTMGFFLPLIVMAICYSWTMVTLFHTRNQQKHKAMRVILAVVLAFIVCWLPQNIAILIDTLMRGGSLVETCEARYRVEMMLHVTQILAFMHCAVNPVLYAFIGEKFRNQLLLALYKHGLISKKHWMSHRNSSVTSVAGMSIKSRNTSISV